MGERGKAEASQAGMHCRVTDALSMQDDDELSGQTIAPRKNLCAGDTCTAVCEVTTRPRATVMDAGTRRARMRKMCQTCNQETAQAGSAARSQKKHGR